MYDRVVGQLLNTSDASLHVPCPPRMPYTRTCRACARYNAAQPPSLLTVLILRVSSGALLLSSASLLSLRRRTLLLFILVLPYIKLRLGMSTNMFAASTNIEPLPLYSRNDPENDPETVSIHSAAPSYISEVPTYTSRRLSNAAPAVPSSRSLLPPVSPGQRTPGLPAADFAPGFQSRRHSTVSDMNHYSFNLPSWSSTRTGHHRRQYEAVARRRASKAAQSTENGASTSAASPYLGTGSPSVSSANLRAYPLQLNVRSSSDPVSPLEDPYLVGEEAARRAKAQRIYIESQRVYREMCLRDAEASRYDGASW